MTTRERKTILAGVAVLAPARLGAGVARRRLLRPGIAFEAPTVPPRKLRRLPPRRWPRSREWR